MKKQSKPVKLCPVIHQRAVNVIKGLEETDCQVFSLYGQVSNKLIIQHTCLYNGNFKN